MRAWRCAWVYGDLGVIVWRFADWCGNKGLMKKWIGANLLCLRCSHLDGEQVKSTCPVMNMTQRAFSFTQQDRPFDLLLSTFQERDTIVCVVFPTHWLLPTCYLLYISMHVRTSTRTFPTTPGPRPGRYTHATYIQTCVAAEKLFARAEGQKGWRMTRGMPCASVSEVLHAVQMMQAPNRGSCMWVHSKR